MYLVDPFDLSLPMKNNPNHEYINLLIVKKLKKMEGITKTSIYYGNSLDETLLTDLSYTNQQSCIAASTKELHQNLLEKINWKRSVKKYEGIGMD